MNKDFFKGLAVGVGIAGLAAVAATAAVKALKGCCCGDCDDDFEYESAAEIATTIPIIWTLPSARKPKSTEKTKIPNRKRTTANNYFSGKLTAAKTCVFAAALICKQGTQAFTV